MTKIETTTVPEDCLQGEHIMSPGDAIKVIRENRIKKVVATFLQIASHIVGADDTRITIPIGHLNNYEIGLIIKKLELAGYTVEPVYDSVRKDLIFSLRISW